MVCGVGERQGGRRITDRKERFDVCWSECCGVVVVVALALVLVLVVLVLVVLV